MSNLINTETSYIYSYRFLKRTSRIFPSYFYIIHISYYIIRYMYYIIRYMYYIISLNMRRKRKFILFLDFSDVYITYRSWKVIKFGLHKFHLIFIIGKGKVNI